MTKRIKEIGFSRDPKTKNELYVYQNVDGEPFRIFYDHIMCQFMHGGLVLSKLDIEYILKTMDSIDITR